MLRALHRFSTRLRADLTLDGRLRLLRPLALLPGPLALAVALAAPYRWLFFFAYAWLFALLACYLWTRALARQVRLRRSLSSAWAEVGDELVEEWVLENPSRVPLVWLEVDDVSTVPGYSARRVAAAGPGETHHWQTSARCTRRGIYTLGPLTARLADPIGIIGAEWRQGEPRQIVVYPSLVQLPALRPPRGLSGGLARADLLQQAATPSVGGLREYVHGDLPSRIHWPTVARTQKLMVKEFDQERAGALWIVLDLHADAYAAPDAVQPPPLSENSGAQIESYGQSSLIPDRHAPQGPETTLELAIVLAGSLAAHALSEGRMVGLIADDGRRRMIPPDQGPRQLWRILGALVDAQATGSVAPERLLARGPGTATARNPGAALALITADLGGRWLADLSVWQTGRAGGAMVLLAVAAGARTGELLGRLAGIGAAAYCFQVGERMPLLRPPRPRPVVRVSPLGRVRTGSS